MFSVVLHSEAFARMRAEAARARPDEACGLLVGRVEPDRVMVDQVAICANADPAPRVAYTVAPEAFLAIERAARRDQRDVVGVWHTHPARDASPSPTDLEGALAGMIYLIGGVTPDGAEDLRAWRRSADGARFDPVALAMLGAAEGIGT